MSQQVLITAGRVSLKAELNDSATAQAIIAALPIKAAGSRWGEEIYFAIPVEEELADDARAEMEVGELGYWPPGTAFCIFWGRTPASSGNEPRAASPVNPIGRILGDSTVLTDVPSGADVRIDKV